MVVSISIMMIIIIIIMDVFFTSSLKGRILVKKMFKLSTLMKIEFSENWRWNKVQSQYNALYASKCAN
jgi:hypothetical protein